MSYDKQMRILRMIPVKWMCGCRNRQAVTAYFTMEQLLFFWIRWSQ